MNRTPIEWTDLSANPIRARRKDGKEYGPGHYCEKVSPGCAHCYASRYQLRRAMPEYTAGSHRDDVEVYLDKQVLVDVVTRRKPAKIFWCDMTDLFGEWVKDQWIREIIATMAHTPWHTHQVLTKRSKRMATWLLDKRKIPTPAWPFLWPGVSVENQKAADQRLGHLSALHGAGWTTFVSYEPALGDVRWEQHEDAFDWLICGGESGPGARPMHPAWPRHARDFCVKHDKAFFFKQWGDWSTEDDETPVHLLRTSKCVYPDLSGPVVEMHALSFPTRDDEEKLEAYYRTRAVLYRVGKKRAGRLLDGQEWNQFPMLEPVP